MQVTETQPGSLKRKGIYWKVTGTHRTKLSVTQLAFRRDMKGSARNLDYNSPFLQHPVLLPGATQFKRERVQLTKLAFVKCLRSGQANPVGSLTACLQWKKGSSLKETQGLVSTRGQKCHEDK